MHPERLRYLGLSTQAFGVCNILLMSWHVPARDVEGNIILPLSVSIYTKYNFRFGVMGFE